MPASNICAEVNLLHDLRCNSEAGLMMALIIGKPYTALRAANVPDIQAMDAAEEIAGYENRLSSIETRLTVLTWMVAVNLAIVVATLALLLVLSVTFQEDSTGLRRAVTGVRFVAHAAPALAATPRADDAAVNPDERAL